MPIVKPINVPMPTAGESAWIAPKKTLHVSTGMDVKQSVSGAIQTEKRQPQTSVETQTAPKEVTLSPQMAAFARKEAAFRQKELAFKEREAAIAAKEVEFGKLTELKTKLAAKDFSILDEVGIDYNEYTNYAVAKLNGTDPKDEAIRQLEAKVDAIKTADEKRVNAQYDATVNQYKRDIKNTVESKPEYNGIKAVEAEEHVLQHILDTFNEEGEILSVDQACKDIRDVLKEEANKYKVFLDEPITKEATSQKTLPPPRQTPRTLTNEVTQVSPSAPRNQFQHMSMKERIAIAAARAQKS
jgi:hypothetical protein